jgi:two-component system C4-dicarboxylate transport sensor histidine kinase DctB
MTQAPADATASAQPLLPPARPWTWREVAARARVMALALASAVAIVGAGTLGYQASWNQGLDTVRTNATNRLDLFASALEGMLNRLEHVPATIQLNRDVVALLRPRSGPASAAPVNLYLHQLNAQLGSLAVYVLNERGVVVASSNAGEPGSFVGEDLAFRPYFIRALSGEVGRHFAIGNTSRQPGYFLANPIRDQGRVIGVAVIKISLAPVAEAWAMLGVPALIADDNQIIVLSSRPGWLYQSLGQPDLDKVIDFQIRQLYLSNRPHRFAAAQALQAARPAEAAQGLLLRGNTLGPDLGREVLAQGKALDKMHWQLWAFTDVDPVRKQALTVCLLSIVAAGFVGLLWLVVAQRQRMVRQKLAAKRMLERSHAELENKVARRTSALAQTNDRLRHEVTERIQAELTLRQAQDELVQAAKMAVVGQMSAGITHEITQPLGAIRTLAGNSQGFLERGDLDTVRSNLGVIARLTDQMGDIVQSLKRFARKAPPQARATDVAQAVHNALLLFMPRIRQDDVTLVNDCPDSGPQAWCDPNRLEQVIVNLVGNALDALRGQPRRELRLHTTAGADGRVQLMVDDTGPGIGPELQAQLFAPFFTTKPQGHGLGLGLTISRDIIQSFSGELRATNRPEGGARFTIDLPERPDPIP